ncbi:hypothetical protein QN372_12370 [Undibacterium sp. RTI2.1]|uniref:hypothetical protein n=1 Tax=unclassified Undibacterium TaxID=2630295 RepID=UPI002AB4FC40|nr:MULTISPECIES: hypothetical protein [unclassified Undibacterium]MDY7538335.1 hypothetical protein [Undibacterium sp. 5I1]MEB0031545.1 hypothetical protein [Undibacterium sp. RTI2.1]MEB0115041.1 hypothetical protein [Undibacterium sp. RTI2.2]MEB0229390.1 hypothetical protein [Undibacterium sp. 10I3]MEB0256000.1 hypothetical protein [Undibacterium sp. 5I1]
MKKTLSLHRLFCLLPALTVAILLVACAEHPAQATTATTPSSAFVQSSTKTNTVAEQLTISGMLTLKGSDVNLWLAVSDANGKVWRLESVDKNRLVQLREWQNRNVKVQGTKLPAFLNINRLEISNINLE